MREAEERGKERKGKERKRRYREKKGIVLNRFSWIFKISWCNVLRKHRKKAK